MVEKSSEKEDAREELMYLMELMDLADCAMFVAKQEPSIEVLYANKKLYSMLQYTPEEFKSQLNNLFVEVVLPEEKQRVKSLIARQSVAGGQLRLEFRVVKQDGLVRWLSMKAEAVTINDTSVYFCSCLDITQQKRNLDEVYNAKKEVELITNSIPGGVIKINMSDFSVLYANDGFYRLSGYSRTEYFSLFGNQCDKVIFPDDAEMVKRMARTAVENRGALGFEYRIIAKSGEIRWSYVNGCRVDDNNGSPVYLCIIMDITSRKMLEEKIEDSIRRSKYLLESMQVTEWTYRIKEQRVYRNGYLERGEYDDMEVGGHTDKEIFKKLIHPEDLEGLLTRFKERREETGQGKWICRIKDNNGNYRIAEINMISVASSGAGEPDIIYGQTRLLEDNSYSFPEENLLLNQAVFNKLITMAKDAREKFDDSVTGLMSPDQFIEAVKEKLINREENMHYGMVCCDINGFGRLNYHYGVSIGNEMLIHLSEVLCENLALDNLCTRISGDYFMTFFSYAEHSDLAKKISQTIRIQSEWEQQKSYKTHGITCGIFLVQEKMDIEIMLERADLARRSIKGMTGSHYAIYTEELQKSRFWDEEMLRDIGKAMKNHTIEIFYLPRIKGNKDNVIGCKSVPRVQIKDGNYLSLEDLRRYLDRSVAVQQLVFYVLSNVCRNMAAWKRNGRKLLPVSVDITSGQLCLQGAVDKLDQIVKSNNLTSRDIIFEIQEPYFGQVTSAFQAALEDLAGRGYRVMISRFASDHTAIHSLRYLPISGIKFHGEFFHQSIKNEKERIVLRKIVEMVQEMGLVVGCGGIETQLQDDIACSIGCEIREGEIFYGTVSRDIYEKCFLEDAGE